MAGRRSRLRAQPGACPSAPGPIAAAELFDAGLRLAQALAARHAAGAYGGVRDALQRPDGTIALGPPTPSDPRDDVRDAMRLLAERAIGRLPAGDRVRHDDPPSIGSSSCPMRPSSGRPCSPGPLPRARTPARERARPLGAACPGAGHPPGARGGAGRPRAQVEIGHDTHIGAIKSRLGQTNQDALFWQSEGDLSLLVVADGISTSTAGSGDLAAGLLVQTFARSWPAHLDHLSSCTLDEIESYLVDTLAQANRSVCERSPQLAGGDLRQQIPMGTTVLACVIRGADAVLASLGDPAPTWSPAQAPRPSPATRTSGASGSGGTRELARTVERGLRARRLRRSFRRARAAHPAPPALPG